MYLPGQGQQKNDYLIKVLVLGESSTGKTSLVKRYVHNFFSPAYKATIGIDFALKVLQYENTIMKLQIWDLAGQERFGTMTSHYYRGAACALLVFDVSRRKTFESVLKWKQDIDNKVRASDGLPLPCLLLANKCDLIQRTEQDEETTREFARQNGFIGCLYTSPKDNINISQAFWILVKEVMRRQQNLDDNDAIKHDTIGLTDQLNHQTRMRQNSKGPCCGS